MRLLVYKPGPLETGPLVLLEPVFLSQTDDDEQSEPLNTCCVSHHMHWCLVGFTLSAAGLHLLHISDRATLTSSNVALARFEP